MKPEYIIIHHSTTKDGRKNDWKAIRRYHTSWRYKGNIITEEEGRLRILAGVRGIEPPWIDIGYNLGLEQEGDQFWWKLGRPLTMNGAHCVEHGMNHKSIGICVVGNYDVDILPDTMFHLLVNRVLELMQEFSIPLQNIKRHCDYAPYKTCPGKLFPWERFMNSLL